MLKIWRISIDIQHLDNTVPEGILKCGKWEESSEKKRNEDHELKGILECPVWYDKNLSLDSLD